jgi:hypothetical protein
MDKILLHKVKLWSRLRISYWLVSVKRKIKGKEEENVPGSRKGKNMGQWFACYHVRGSPHSPPFEGVGRARGRRC